MVEYWEESVAQSLEEYGVVATKEQVSKIARDMQLSHENYGLAYYQPENPLIDETRRLKEELAVEKSKVACDACFGQGSITVNFLSRSSTSRCPQCNGEGKWVRR